MMDLLVITTIIIVRISIIELLILYCCEKICEVVTKQEDYGNQGFDSSCCKGYAD